jgi:hypothetical protein
MRKRTGRRERVGAALESLLFVGISVAVAALLLQRGVSHAPAAGEPEPEDRLAVKPAPTHTATPFPLPTSIQGAVRPAEHATAPPPVPGEQAAPAASPGPVPYQIIGHYEKFGQTWACVLVPPETNRHSLVQLAQQMHQQNPDMRYRFFDDDQHYQQYIEWHINYPDAAAPYPGAWVAQHHVAVINRVARVADGSVRWRLLTPYGEVIADLEE